MPVRRRRNPSDIVFIRAMLKQAVDGLMYGIDEITNVTVHGTDTATKAELTKFRKVYKEASKALLAVYAAQLALK